MNPPLSNSSMTEKWNNRALFRLLWPLIIEQLLALTMGVADTVMVSSTGEYAVSAVNIIDNINNLLVIAFMALSTGGAVVCSQYIGRQDAANARLASRQLVYSVTIVSVVITLLALVLRKPAIGFFYGKIEEDVMGAAMTYFLFSAFSYPALGLYNACAALYRSAGNSQVPMKIALLINVLKIGFNAVLIYGLGMGVAGAALSTLLCRAAAAVILILKLTRLRNSPVSLSGILDMRLVPSMIRRILRIGVPTGLESSMFQFGRLLTQRIFPIFGTGVMAANAVAGVLNSISFMTGNAYCMALLTVVSQCIGAGDYDAAKKHAAKLVKITWITIFIISGLTFVFREFLAGLFNLSPEALGTAKIFLSIHCVSMAIGWTFSFAIPNALRAAGDAKYVMIVATVSMWVVRVSAAYFLAFTLKIGPAAVWIAMGLDFISRGVCYVLRWRRGKWQKAKSLTD